MAGELDRAIDFANSELGIEAEPPKRTPLQTFGDAIGMNMLSPIGAPLETKQRVANKNIRFGQNAVAEIASLPGAAPGVVGIVEAGVRAGITAASSESTDNLLARSIASDSGRQKLDIGLDPNTPPEIAALVLNTFDPEADINWGLRGAIEWYDFGSELAGIERTPGEVPLDEEIFGIVASAFVGLPRAAISQVTMRMSQIAGRTAALQFAERMATSRAGRIGIRTAEIATPITLPLTPANIVVNAAAATGINDAIRTLTDETSLINYASAILSGGQPTPQEPPSTPVGPATPAGTVHLIEGEIALAGLSGGSISDVGMSTWQQILLAGLVAGGGAVAIKKFVRNIVPDPQVTGGPSFLETGNPFNKNLTGIDNPENKLDQILTTGSIAQTLGQDSRRALTRAEEVARGIQHAEIGDALAATRTSQGLEHAVDHANDRGILPDGRGRIPAPRRTEAAAEALASVPVGRDNAGIAAIKTHADLFAWDVEARQALRYRNLARAHLNDEAVRLRQGISDATGPEQIRRMTTELNEIEDMLIRAQDIRMSLTDFSDTQLRRVVALADQVPDIVRLRELRAQQLDGDLEYRVRSGQVAREDAQAWKDRWGSDYSPLQEDILAARVADAKTPVGRAWVNLRHHATKRINAPPINRAFALDKSRSVETDDVRRALNNELPRVNNPVEPHTALRAHLSRSIRQGETGALRRRLVDVMSASPETRGALRLAASLTRGQIASGRHRKVTEASRMLAIPRAGKVEYWEFGDDLLRQALDFSPSSVLPILNESRRIFQSLTTGKVAFWFAPKAFVWDTKLGMVTRNKGRSFGVIDGALQTLTKGKIALPGDPTAFLMSTYGIGAGFARSMQREIGQWVATELAEGSTVFGKMSQANREQLIALGEGLVDNYERSYVGVLHNEVRYSTNTSWMEHAADKNLVGWRKTTNPLIRTYGNLMESIHNGAKIGFFTQNVVAAKLAGRPLTRTQMLVLGNETRRLAGDMSKSGLSKTYQQTASVLPYSNIFVQSTAHAMGMFKRNPRTVMFGLMNGVGIPTAVSLYNIQEAGEATQDWWFNQVPDWQRAGNMAFPIARPEAALEIMNGTYVHDSADWVLVPVAPEFIPIKQTFAWGLGTMGFDQGRLVENGEFDDLREAFKALVPMLTPPLASAGAEAAGYRLDLSEILSDKPVVRPQPQSKSGRDPNTVVLDSNISNNVMGMITSLLGTAGRIGGEMAVTGEVTLEETRDYAAALDAMFDEGAFQAERRTSVLNTAVWGIDTQYSSTPVTESYYETIRDLATVFNQFDIEIEGAVGNSSGMLFRTPGMNFPDRIVKSVDGVSPETIRQMVVTSELMLEGNPVLGVLRERMALNLKNKEFVRNDRSNPRARHDRLNALELARQENARYMFEAVIQPWEDRMRLDFGDDFTIDEFVRIVRESVGPPTDQGRR